MWRYTQQMHARRAHARSMAWTLALLVSLMLAWLLPTPAYAAGVDDLMPNIQVNEHHLSDPVRKFCACAVASAAMIVDYYQVDYRLPVTTHAATINDVAPYIPISVSQTGLCTGSNPNDVPSELVNAEAAIHPTLPLTATMRQTNANDWFPTLQAYLDQELPVMVFIPNGANLHGTDPYNWGHTVVVSGYTANGSIIYHDPWDGRTYTKSNTAFANAWDTPYPPDDPGSTFYYVQVLPPGVASPWPTSTPPPIASVAATASPTPSPTSSIVPGGLWISPADGATVTDPVQFAAHAYPTTPGDPAIDHVNFTVESQGNWQVACTVPSSYASGDVYTCDVTLSDLGIQAGQIQVSFDVYDVAKDVNYAPNGVHTLTYASSSQTATPTSSSLIAQLVVTPSSLTPSSPGCSDEGGMNYQCPLALQESANSTEDLGWAISTDMNVQISGDESGTLTPGQSTTLTILFIPCQNGSFIFTWGGQQDLQQGTVTVPWSCS